MAQATVKARKVGDSVVMTLPTGILKSTGFKEGDCLLLETKRAGFLSIQKEGDKVSNLREANMELQILQRKLEVVNAEATLAVSEHNNSMPTVHPGINDSLIMEGFMKELDFKRSKVQLKIAKKEIAIYRMGEPEPQ